MARKFDGSNFGSWLGVREPKKPSRISSCAWHKRTQSWGYDRIEGALANLGHTISDQTIGNILKRHGIALAPQRKHTTRWRDFIREHMAVLAGCDFFTVEVLTLKGLVTYYVLFFIQLETRRVCLAGITQYPDQEWMDQQARNVTMKDLGFPGAAATCC